MKKKVQKKRILKSLLDIRGFTNFVESPDLIMGLIIEECVLSTGAESGIILTYDKNLILDDFQITKVINDKEKMRISSALDGVVKDAINTNGKEAVLEVDLWNKKDMHKLFKDALDKKIKTIAICPIKKKEQFLGLAIVVDKKGGGIFTKKDRENFFIICQEASIVIDNINLFKAKLQNEKMAAIGQTITGISHYIKNVLQGVSAGSYLLDAGLKDEDLTIVSKAWNVVNKNSKRISELVTDMLYYSKERSPIRQKTETKVLIDDILELVQLTLKQKKVKLKTAIMGLPRNITVDEKGIHRSILNIILNAIDAYDKRDSVIEFKASLDKPTQNLKIIISDNGKGLSKEEQGKIFQPFYSTKKGKGTGLGLAITKKIIEEHGGSIKLASELKRGATFEISIPVKTSV